jgi:D-alanyl-lipoteichoic acid acyltransferase DltB (MBOAT superfamily)
VVFSSISFLFYFLPLFMASYFLMPTTRAKNLITLVFSLIFYAWGEPWFVFVLLGSISVNTFMAQKIDGFDGTKRRNYLAVAIVINLALLGIFKYATFIVGNLAELLQAVGVVVPVPQIPLPLGISFFTFHSLSYLIDVYRRQFPANRDPIEVALYIALFPQLIAGPIVRYKTVARQLGNRHHTLGRASAGFRIFVIGLAQKVLIADPVSQLAEAVFDHTAAPSFADAWVGLLAYTIQIYFDFAGYSNMAIGLALSLGISFPRNFRLPYASRSITEFWRRWHISLSSWLRDYLYIPLGGSYGLGWQTYRNLVTVFLLCGLWHGASWTFVLWGSWHGLLLVIERLGLTRALTRLPDPLRWAYLLLAVMWGWVLFRAHDTHTALAMYGALLGLNGFGGLSFSMHMLLQPGVVVALAAGCLLCTMPPLPKLWRAVRPIMPISDAVWTFGLLFSAVVSVAAGTYSPFLYYRF